MASLPIDLFSYSPEPEEFPIERGVPISRDESPRQRAKWHRPEFPFDRMEVGDSFTVRPEHCGGAPLIVVQNLASGAASTYCKGFVPGARKFTTRQIGGRFVRVWRTV